MRENRDSTDIAILAKAPIPGLAKTRLIPALGRDGAALLHGRLVDRTVETAVAAGTGPVTVWATPDTQHPLFQALETRFPIGLASQPEGDLGRRMLAAVEAADRPVLVIGCDCPALTSQHLRDAARALAEGCDGVIIPAEDGGYVLIGLRHPQPVLFGGMTWSVPTVLDETRRRARTRGLCIRELPPLWDVDQPVDLERLRGPRFDDLVAGLAAKA